MPYKYKVCSKVDPNLLEKELKDAGSDDWKLVHVQVFQEIKNGMQLNGSPIIKLTYQLIFINESE